MHYVVQHLRADRPDPATGHPGVDLRLFVDAAAAWREADRLAGLHGLAGVLVAGGARPVAYSGPGGSIEVVPLEVRS